MTDISLNHDEAENPVVQNHEPKPWAQGRDVCNEMTKSQHLYKMYVKSGFRSQNKSLLSIYKYYSFK